MYRSCTFLKVSGRQNVNLGKSFPCVHEVDHWMIVESLVELWRDVMIIQIARCVVANLLELFCSGSGQVTLKELHCRDWTHIEKCWEQFIEYALPDFDSGLGIIFDLAQLEGRACPKRLAPEFARAPLPHGYG